MKRFRILLSVVLVLSLVLSMFPVFALEAEPAAEHEAEPVRAVHNSIIIDDNAAGGYEGDYVVIYNPATSSSTSYSTGTMTGLIETSVGTSSHAQTRQPANPDRPYKIDVDSRLAEYAKTAEIEPAPEGTRASYNVGSTKTFSLINAQTNASYSLQFKCLYVGQHCYIWTPTSTTGTYYPLDQIDSSFAQMAANEFDSKFDLMQSSFGNHTNGSSGDGKLHMLYYNIEDGWQPGQGYIAGFFYQGDISSNGLPILNIDTYPGVYYKNSSGTEYKRMDTTYGTMVHEYQHLINYSNTSGMGTWLNECFSAAAEEICYPGSSLVGRIQSWENYYYSDNGDWLNPPAEFQYQSSNSLHTGYSMYAWSNSLDNTSLLTLYSQVSFFAQYLYTRFGNTIYKQISSKYSSSETSAITSATGVSCADLVRDFRVAVTANATQDQYNGIYGFKVQNGYDPSQYNDVQSPWDLLGPVVFTGTSCSIKGGGAITVKPVNGVYNPPSGASSSLKYIGIKLASPYTVTAVSNNTNYGTVSVNGTTITASPAAGYYVESCTVTAGTATYTINGNTIAVTPSSDCTIQVNFAPKPQYTVNFVACGNAEGSQTAYVNDAITLPATVSASADGWTFSGWMDHQIDETAEKPTYYAPGAAYTVTGNTTLYALYTRVEAGSGEVVYQLADGLENGEKYILVDQSSISGTTGYAVGNSIVASNHYLNAVSATISDDTCTVSSSGLAGVVWQAASSGSGYTFYNAAVGKYIGLDSSEYVYPSSTALAWAYTSEGYLDNQTDSEGYYYLSYDTTNSRYTTNKSGKVINLYKETNLSTTYYWTDPVVAEHEHTMEYVAAVAPTCGAEGHTAYYHCTVCGKYYSDANGENEITLASTVIPATGNHSFGSYVSNNNGTHKHVCSVCGAEETENCTYTDVVTAPTATEQGYTTHTCTVCGYSFVDSYTAPLGNDYPVHFSVPAGVTAPADMISNTNTGITLPTAEAPEGYTFLGWVTEDYDNVETRPATILTGNYIAPQEITLKALYTYTEGNSGSETVYELVSTAPSDIAGDYVITFGTSETSNEQGFFLMKGVEAATSNYGIESPANRVAFADTGATLDGTTLKNVANDYVFNVAFLGTYYTIQSKSTGIYLGMNNSSYFSGYDTYNSTYCRWTIPAVADNFCSAKNARSGASYPYISFGYESSQYSEPYFWAGSSDSIGATGLALSVRWWKATEIEAGTAYYTTIIGEEHVHTPAAPVKENEVPATCTEAGSYDAVVYCSECGEEISRETIAIPALGHNYESVVTAPTCTEQGFTTHTCSRCGDSYVDNYTDALGHDFGEWIVTTEPTCTALGTETRTCSRCNATETRDVAALGHDYQAVVTAPTCTEAGYTTYTCSRCGDSYTADEVTALGHLAGEAVEENRVEPTTTTEGGYDTVVYCQRCGAELSREHTVLPMITVEYFVNNSISLAGDIGVNFYVNLNEVSKDNAKVVFTWGSDKYAKTKEATFSGLTADGNGNYKLSVPVYAKQMTEVIHAELYDGTEKIAEKDYSVADYCRTVLNMPIKQLADAYYDGNEAKAEKLVNLCKAMLIYGGMAQKQFKYRTDDRADKDLEYTLEDVGALGTTTFPEGFAEACGIEFKMSSLMLESETSYRMYFSVTDQTKLDNLTVKLGDETLTYTKKGSYIYYSISNIPAKMILSDYTLTFGDQTVTANPGEYIAKALDKGNDDLKETVKALYWYSTAAIEYFAN